MAGGHPILELLLLAIFHIIKGIFVIVQQFKWHFDGTEKHHLKIQQGGRYEGSGQLLDIRLKKNLDPVCINNSLRPFLLTHNAFVDPTYVLKKEVSLFYVDHNEAVFVEAPPGVEVWRSKYAAWHRLAQYKYAVKLIRMPLQSFFRLVRDFEDPGEKLILLEFIPRTGSTLLCQLFEATGQAVSYAEPDVLLCPFSNIPQTHHVSRANKEKQLKAVIKYMCRPHLTVSPASAYIAKIPTCFLLKNKEIFKKCFPKAKLLFLYRNADNTINSMERTLPNLPMPRACYFFLYWCSSVWRMVVILACTVYMSNPDDETVRRVLQRSKQPEKLRHYVYYSCMMGFFLKQQDTVLKVPAIKYEDLMHNRQRSVEVIFDHCGLSRDLVSRAMCAFDRDSQTHSVLARDKVSNARTVIRDEEVQPEVYLDIEEIFQHFGVPWPCEDYRIPNTITSPGET